jgi:hypothetical protein
MPDSHDDAVPRARRRPGDAPEADQPREARRSHHAHGGWAVGGRIGISGSNSKLRRVPALRNHARALPRWGGTPRVRAARGRNTRSAAAGRR